MILRRI